MRAAINTLTNTIFVLNSVTSSISVIEGNTDTLTGTINITVPNRARWPFGERVLAPGLVACTATANQSQTYHVPIVLVMVSRSHGIRHEDPRNGKSGWETQVGGEDRIIYLKYDPYRTDKM